MKKKLIVIMVLMLSVMMAMYGCDTNPGVTPGGDNNRPKGDNIVIYTGGSSEFTWIQGSEEDKIISEVEKQYYEDTGISLNFDIAFLGEDMHTKLSNELAAGTQVDIVVSHTRGGVGVDDKLKGKNSHINLTDPLYDYAPNLLAQIKGAPLDSLTTFDDDVIGIPSVISPYKFGILVRKDYMEAAGFTDDAAKALTEFKDGKNYELVDNLDTFAAMCKEINKITKNAYAVTGAAWDLEKVLVTGAYADAGYFSNVLTTEGTSELVMSGGATKAYKDILALEYKWANEGVISKDANSILVTDGESNFISGKTGVFVLDPTIQHLIKVARMTKIANSDAEFTVLGPLKAHKDSPDAKKGFMRNTEATFGAIITGTSKKSRPIMQFLNWVYSDADNYNLCRYGVEGEHWVNNGDGTYSYPEGKEEYLTEAPYSGILTLVENQRISNLRYKGYSEEELHWINDIAGNADNYIDNDLADYMFISSDQHNIALGNATAALYAMATESWTGKTDPLSIPTGKTKCVFDDVTSGYNSAVKDAQVYFTTQYKTMKASRADR